MFIFVVKPLGRCRRWGSSRSVALLSTLPEAQCAAPGGPHPMAPHGVTGAGAFFLLVHRAVSFAGAEGGPLEGTGYAVSGGHSEVIRVFSRITSATATAATAAGPSRQLLGLRRVPPLRASAGA
ncbi:unnamed protein product [Pleuronectes platessa]|uniref:Uncharacterized protein n=1 Tax=Pleuronectes platessa TaxID=8262 RepID=A0A9N7YMA3_PLEPL|nr:unnamed protein product [Pleuronectes platessa]